MAKIINGVCNGSYNQGGGGIGGEIK